MKFLSRINRLAVLLAAIALLLLQTVPLSAALYEEEVSTGQYLYLKGMVRSVSAADKSLVLKQMKGPSITIRVTPATEFEGVRRFEDLKDRQVIKVWYQPGPDGNLGLKIQRLPDMGC